MASLLENEGRELELRYSSWNHAVQDYVGSDLFRYVQFINNNKDVMFGSAIQRVVCTQCGFPECDRLEFWTNVGDDTVQKVLRRKRQSITTSFQLKFESK